jgi:hypothetical protein
MPFPLLTPLLTRDQLLTHDDLTYDRLQQCYRKSVRTRTWRRLCFLAKALFRASLDYLQRGGRIAHVVLVAHLVRLQEGLYNQRY